MNDLTTLAANHPWAITVASSAILAAISWVISSRLRPRKSLAWHYDTAIALRYSKRIGSDLIVTYRGHPVDSLWLTQLTIHNNGNAEFVDTDFHSPLKIISSDSRLLSVELDTEDQSATSTSISSTNDKEALIEVKLLNPGEKIRVSILSDDNSSFELKYRIKGVARIKRVQESTRHFFPTVFTAACVSALISFLMPEKELLEGSRLATFALFVFSLSVYGFLLLQPRVRKNFTALLENARNSRQ